MAITPNVVVSQPSQLFTLARSFKANANGKIYIGQIDTDPTIPSNQIQVYLENEDGSHVPVAQPIVINAGGYPVYNGQIAKFVTVQGHSMAIYDAYNVQQFYFPNVLKYDPDQFKLLINSSAGASEVGTSSGKTVQEELDDLHQDITETNTLIASNFISQIMPSSVPTIGNGVKAVMKITDSSDFYIIAKKADGKTGYVSMRVTNAVSDSDAENYGGASPFRLGSVDNIVTALTAKLVPSAKTAGVVLSTLTTSQIATVYGFTASGGGSINASLATGDFSLSSPQIYSIPNTDSVTYQVTQKKAKIRFARTNASSQIVNIYTSINGTNWVLSNTITTQLPPSGTVRGYDIEIDGITDNPWYLKVENAHANPAYVAGLNIEPIGGDFIYDYDQFIATLTPALTAGVSYYLGGLGANEFAAKEKSTGKFFGTYHGGHEGFLQRFRTDSASYNLDSSTAPVLLLTKHALLHSASTLRVSSTLYSYVASTQFGDGVAITNYAIKLGSGTPILCERIYTHMCTSARTFNWIHLPIAINKEDDSDVLLGQTGMIQQYRAEDAVTINCYFSQVNLSQNGNGGAYISFQPNYNKQYYGPALGSIDGYPVIEGLFTTCKEFF